jgi:hypothetical protein
VGGNATLVPTANVENLFGLLGVENFEGRLQGSVEHLSLGGEGISEVDEAVSAFAGPGRSSDPKLRLAVEQHAVRLAKRHMREQGWTQIEELGKPFDLVCRRGSEEKHVEVKGTTGAGGAVTYTRNEVAHFRACPHGADLIVVREIAVDRRQVPYATSGGTLLHVENYLAPDGDLSPLSFEGRVPW